MVRLKGEIANEHYSEAETEQRREAALKRMLATPHKPHTASKQKRPDSSQTVQK